jgi:hypothetical protein
MRLAVRTRSGLGRALGLGCLVGALLLAAPAAPVARTAYTPSPPTPIQPRPVAPPASVEHLDQPPHLDQPTGVYQPPAGQEQARHPVSPATPSPAPPWKPRHRVLPEPGPGVPLVPHRLGQTVTVPRLTGSSLSVAQSRLLGTGLRLGSVVGRAVAAPAGTVVGTSPPAYSRVPAGSAIDLIVAVP